MANLALPRLPGGNYHHWLQFGALSLGDEEQLVCRSDEDTNGSGFKTTFSTLRVQKFDQKVGAASQLVDAAFMFTRKPRCMTLCHASFGPTLKKVV